MENHGSDNISSVETLPYTNGLIHNFNLDLTQSILSHIPIEFVSRSRAVCKLWRTLLRKPKTGFLFAVSENQEEIQLFHGYSDELGIDDAPISYKTLAKIDLGLGTSRNLPVKLIHNGFFNPIMFGSCNGLVCLPVQKDNKQCLVYICNPMTRECVFLPAVDLGKISRPEVFGGFGKISRPEVFGGFGYCQSTNQYKVVQVVYQYNRFRESGKFQVYTLGDGRGWRNKGEIRYTKKERLVYANDAFYWPERSEDDWKINVFDLANETFGTLPMPPCDDVVHSYRRLVSLSGCLCFCYVSVEKCVNDDEIISVRQEDKRLDMWMLKKEQEKRNKIDGYSPVDEKDDLNRWVWIKEFSMEYKTDAEGDFKPFGIMDNGQVLMWGEEEDRFHQICRYLICYDRDTASRNVLWNKGLRYAQAIPHVNSFVSLKDLGEKSARYTPGDNELIHLSQKL